MSQGHEDLAGEWLSKGKDPSLSRVWAGGTEKAWTPDLVTLLHPTLPAGHEHPPVSNLADAMLGAWWALGTAGRTAKALVRVAGSAAGSGRS